jgi:hypothetical protein
MIATLVVYVVYSALAFVIHNIILEADYVPLLESGVLRPVDEFGLRAPLLYLGNLVFALAFCAIYTYGYEPGKNWLGQGIRYGLLLGTLLAPVAITEYVVYPVAGPLALKWILFGYFQALVSGVVLAALYTLPAPGKA